MIDTLNQIVTKALELGAHDVHLKAAFPPIVRVADEIRRLEFPPSSPKDLERLVVQVLDERRLQSFKARGQIDCSFELVNGFRARANIFLQRNSLALSLRLIPGKPPALGQLGFSKEAIDLLKKATRGMVLITGATNSGKSTTAASLIDTLAQENSLHIITIEDPVEYLFGTYQHSIVSQRQVGEDATTFHRGLTAALRQDPDVLFIGELRDQETVETCLKAAETGHLVVGTLHTADATQSILRLINIFPSHQRDTIRFMLSSCLKVILSQTLIPLASRKGRALAFEVLPMPPSVCNLIRQKKIHEISSILRVGRRSGCIPMYLSIQELVKSGQVKSSDVPPELKIEGR
ncbi:MAG: PilT/PilU family type 4a pilus ATPase [Candidatus Riflebacteria bacterium]|nr:PilT/PilU family type 4a pilus ATPase [Candidatus Riflebacteria bacterium]